MPLIDLPHGTVDYRAAGPEDSALPPVVFVHGFLLSGTLWRKTADALAAAGVRSYAPDWPLGGHRIPVGPAADQTPYGIAGQIVAFLEALELRDVTLVGNDSGGAICQYVLDLDASRIGRVVFTNCDAFEVCPPKVLKAFVAIFRRPGRIRLVLQGLRVTAIRHSVAGFGLYADRDDLDAAQTRAWVEPCLTNADVRRQTAAFVRGIDADELVDVGSRLRAFPGPALLVWGTHDRFFPLDLARRLAAAFADAELVTVDGGRTFLPLGKAERIAQEIVAFSRRAVPAAPPAS